MTRDELIEYIKDEYGVMYETPFPKDPESLVFRHKGNRKWFALLMRIDGDKLGRRETVRLDIVNVKAEPDMVAAVVGSNGIYAAYHMNKKHWITLVLDKNASDENVKALVDMSFALTAQKKKKGEE